jgi:hypothetical protein
MEPSALIEPLAHGELVETTALFRVKTRPEPAVSPKDLLGSTEGPPLALNPVGLAAARAVFHDAAGSSLLGARCVARLGDEVFAGSARGV